MRAMDRFDMHAGLVARMAETLGADLEEAAFRGNLPPEGLRDLVLNCMGCREAGACGGWLAENAGGADAAPGYCRNRERLQALAVL
jgi:hypothetical protein